MTPSEAVDRAIREARTQFRYIPDPPGVEGDEWDTVQEFERRDGGDCDGWVLWTCNRANILVPSDAAYWFVWGTIKNSWETFGHAWVEVRGETGRLWADPTWGNYCERPGWFAGRTPYKAYPTAGEIMGKPVEYVALS